MTTMLEALRNIVMAHDRNGSDYRTIVEAVVLALRDPTVAMVEAGRKKCADTPSNYGDVQAAAVWRAMIDVILQEQWE